MRLKEKAVTAAEELFEKYHFSLENLAHALNCGLGELVKAIGSLDQVVLEVNSRTMDRVLAAVGKEASKTGLPAARVESICQVFLRFAQKNKAFVELLFQHPFPEKFQRPGWYLQQVAACFSPLEQALKALASSKSADDINLAARGLWSQVLGVFYLCYNERVLPVGIRSQEELVTFNVRMFLKGWAEAPLGKAPKAKASGRPKTSKSKR